MANLLVSLVTTILFFFAVFSCTQAQQTPDREQVLQTVHKIAERFQTLDSNGDGMLSRDEFPRNSAQFDRLDADGDGLISRQEVKGMVKSRIKRAPTPTPLVQAEPKSVPRVRFGLCTTPRALKREIEYVKELGIGAVRFPMPWQWAEPREGKFDWRQIDQLVDLSQTNGAQVLFMIRSISDWGTKAQTKKKGLYHSASMPHDLSQWEHFIETLAARYKGRGVHYEIENEVSAAAFWNGTKEEYAELLKVSYRAIKRIDPQAIVLSAAMPCAISRKITPEHAMFKKYHDDWLRVILPTKAFDVVSVHNYYFPSDIVANGFTFRSYQEHIRDLMKEAGVGNRPVWITEAGYVSRRTSASGRVDEGSPERQAKWMKEAYQQAPELGVERLFWILLRDRDESYFGSMGLGDAQGKHRPAWEMLRELKKDK